MLTFLEQADDFGSALHSLIRQVIHDHKRIIFNGNGYEEAWVEEAAPPRFTEHAIHSGMCFRLFGAEKCAAVGAASCFQ